MFKFWESMEDSSKQYFINLWESQGIDMTAYKHLFPTGKIPIPKPIPKPKAPPVVKPVPKPKVPKIGPKIAKLIEDTYIEIDTQIVYLQELMELTAGIKNQGFEELVAHLQQRLLVVDEINNLNQKLIAMGAKPRVLPKGIEKIQKKVIEKAKEVEKVIQFPGAKTIKQQSEVLEKKLKARGISNIIDESYYDQVFNNEEWLNNILQPLSDDLDRLVELNPILADALEHIPVRRLQFLRGWNLEKIGWKGADGLYQSGFDRSDISLASRASKSMKEPVRALQVGKRRILSDGSEVERLYSAHTISSESGVAQTVWQHELGHHVHMSQLRSVPVWNDLNLTRAWNDIWDQKGSQWFKKNVTLYSGANVREAFAETFAAYYNPLYKRGLLPEILEEFMDGLSTGIYQGYNALLSENTLAKGASIMAKKMSASEIKQAYKALALEQRPTNMISLASERKPKLTSGYMRDKKGKWSLKGKPVSQAIEKKLNKMAIPPAWTQVIANTDFNAETRAVGRDAVNKLQYRFSAKRTATSAKKKYIRTKNFEKDMPGIRKKIEDGIKKGDPRAFVLELENKTAIRIGTDRDFQAKVKAYGLTTLQNEHVVIRGNKIIIDFTAKKGTHGHYEIVDERLAKFLQERKNQTKKGMKLFPDVTANKLNAYLKELANGKKYTIKDFRTYHATRIAREELKKYPKKLYDAKEKRTIVKMVSEVVSKFLSNTPKMAENSYIDPMVWEIIGGL